MDRFDPYSEMYHADPYAVYAHFRDTDPVHWGAWPDPTVSGSWFLFRYEDVANALKHDGLVHARTSAPPPAATSAFSVLRYADKFFNGCDPPTHTRLRALVGSAFTRDVVSALRGYTEEVADELLETMATAGEADLMADFAGPLPLRVVCRLLGVEIDDYASFRRWSHDLSRLAEESSPQLLMKASEACDALAARVGAVIEERRYAPQDDLVTNLLQVVDDDEDGLSEDELVATCMLLLVAGHETTANLIGNGTLALLRHPDLLATLRSRPDLMAGAVEELLRYDAPGRIAVRWAAEELYFGDKVIQRGDRVGLVIGSANRDPEQFEDADALDFTRKPRHLGFGLGIHFCLGAPLARMEAEIAFTRLLQRFPDLRLATETPAWQRRVSIRALESLPVEF